MFPTLRLSKALTLGGHINVRVLRDHAKREAFAAAEQTRQALRYIAQNTQLPLLQRTKAQVELALMDSNTRRMKIKNRCVTTGRGRGILRNFRICRYQFRLLGKAGDLPGVKKANW
ncbi:glucocorticoid receptor-like (DNA-binding domain) [Choiromyces venosus 120613-1]|uniref:Glucocorticoid receptor-like (DNA-binding domain) n=1 Tax=Choiromyces venosus 120613-1 TaxID=1336337 RepID=A0A3N4JAJ3_9PEZI|nr:glucocorticoid receptor-like (DNA-binding domain) [Choiromyces venosus 120613-1]